MDGGGPACQQLGTEQQQPECTVFREGNFLHEGVGAKLRGALVKA